MSKISFEKIRRFVELFWLIDRNETACGNVDALFAERAQLASSLPKHQLEMALWFEAETVRLRQNFIREHTPVAIPISWGSTTIFSNGRDAIAVCLYFGDIDALNAALRPIQDSLGTDKIMGAIRVEVFCADVLRQRTFWYGRFL